MAPTDPTPQADQVMHESDEPRFPEPSAGAGRGGSEGRSADADRDEGDGPEARARVDPITGAGEDIAG